jgi:hypothetical protein
MGRGKGYKLQINKVSDSTEFYLTLIQTVSSKKDFNLVFLVFLSFLVVIVLILTLTERAERLMLLTFRLLLEH